MDRRTIIQFSGPATKLAYVCIISTVGITLLCYVVIHYSRLDLDVINSYHALFGLAINLASTSSPILTCLITELKIGKSEIGRLAVHTGIANDMICTSIMCIGVVIYGTGYRNPNSSYRANVINSFLHALFIAFEIFFISKFINPLIDVVNSHNPEGKPIRGIDLLIVSSISLLLCFGSVLLGFDANFNAFTIGLCLPRQGRISNFLISRINFAVTTFILPLYIVLVGFSTDYREWAEDHNHIVYKLLILGSIRVVGKLTWTVAYNIQYGLQWPEAVALGMLLNVKGYFHIFCAFDASMIGIIDLNTMMVIVVVTVGTIIPTPLVVAFIVRRARVREYERPMGLQWCNTGGEMRILVGLHGPQDVPLAINVMESMRGQADGFFGRMLAYMVEMVEMTDKAATSLVHRDGMDAITVTDEEIVEWREQIGSALEVYMEEIGDGIGILNVEVFRLALEDQAVMGIIRAGSIAFAFYLFALGLEMDPRTIIQFSGPATKLAYTDIISTVGITLLCYVIIHYSRLDLDVINSYHALFGLAIGLASTSSPILTCLITELKIEKSEIGRLAVHIGLANDMICTSIMCIGVVIYGTGYRNPNSSFRANAINSVLHALFIAFEIFFISEFINPLIYVVNSRSIGVVGKLTGTVTYNIRYGLQWPEAVALGMLFNVKGYFHIFCAFGASMIGIVDLNTMMMIVLVTVGTIIPTPLVVAFIVRRAMAREYERPMGLQWCNTGGEMRILVGLHGPQDVPLAINVMESMRGQADGFSGGLLAHMVEMVEMTDKAAASLVHRDGMDAITVTDEKIIEWREQIGSNLEVFMEEIRDGDCMAALVVLPFHRRLRVDGEMDTGHRGYRVVNQKVLQLAPCSVAILVDRGLGRAGSQLSLSSATLSVCAVFIGGADDREALAYASKVVHHPGMRLMIVRFLPDAAASGKVTGPGRRVLTAVGKQEMEQKADDEYFAGFYERYVAGGNGVGYMEKHVGSGAETVAVLRTLEGRYELFIVGRGRDRDSVLTAGMNEWAECPELGPIGDILAASDFSVTASVLVIQQHDALRKFDVIDEEFLPL
ncbi:Cation/H(+) antiporter 28 [Platanthera guangdongensis]|uniref:Cation/H(+) antiporter 28 n=1 Tax=Platanthera guangdongensis TaxID=2320717 RepID=A0ABR2LLB6_9ASPA